MAKDRQELDLYSLRSSSYKSILGNADSRRKVHLFNAMVPAGCETVLDMGGASGWVTLELRKTHRIVTQDKNYPSLVEGTGDRVASDAASLPFKDGSFDIVISSEVLEHLPEDIYNKARMEIARVARLSILISVPYRENLTARMVRCPFCGHIFHKDHHLRSFTEQNLVSLFENWTLMEWYVFGEMNENSGLAHPSPITPQRKKARLASTLDNTVCPVCGRQVVSSSNQSAKPGVHRSENPTPLLKYKQQFAGYIKKRQYPRFIPQDKAPYWIAALYLPQGSGPWVDSPVETDGYEY